MAFNIAYFGPIGTPSKRGKFPMIWGFKTEQAHAAVDAAGYFNTVSNLVSIGDLILVEVVTNLGASNEALSTIGWHVVNANASGVVDTTNVNVITLTDSD